ncbi:MAG: hypothetical protein AAB152_16340 [Candidatus Coatesbacteria bacterium]
MMIFLTGPCGGGKTTLAHAYCTLHPECRHVDMDSLISEWFPAAAVAIGWNNEAGNALFFDATLACVARLGTADPTAVLLVDMGAGSLEDARAVEFFASRRDRHIAIHTSPATAFDHLAHRAISYWRNNTVEEYSAVEYSPRRVAIYESATVTIDTAVPIDQCLRQLEKAVDELSRPSEP